MLSDDERETYSPVIELFDYMTSPHLQFFMKQSKWVKYQQPLDFKVIQIILHTQH